MPPTSVVLPKHSQNESMSGRLLLDSAEPPTMPARVQLDSAEPPAMQARPQLAVMRHVMGRRRDSQFPGSTAAVAMSKKGRFSQASLTQLSHLWAMDQRSPTALSGSDALCTAVAAVEEDAMRDSQRRNLPVAEQHRASATAGAVHMLTQLSLAAPLNEDEDFYKPYEARAPVQTVPESQASSSFVAQSFAPSAADQEVAQAILASMGAPMAKVMPQSAIKRHAGSSRCESNDKIVVVNSKKAGRSARGAVREATLRCSGGTRYEPLVMRQGRMIKASTPSLHRDQKCLVFACVVVGEAFDIDGTPNIMEIRGYTEHSEGCLEDTETTRPAIFVLDPALRAAAERSIAQVHSTHQVHHAILQAAAGLSPHSVYRRQHTPADISYMRGQSLEKKYGVTLSDAPVVSLHKLLTREPAAGQSVIGRQLQESVFLYQPETRTSRLMLVICSNEMALAAREHAHGGVLLMDGTFNVCRDKVLLFLVLTIDNSGGSVPIAAFLFTPAKGAKSASASYDARILEQFLTRWRNHVCQSRDGQEAAEMRPTMAMTDSDEKEKLALASVFDCVILRTCHFHVWQSWKNAFNRYVPSSKGNALPRQQVKIILSAMETRLMSESLPYDEQLEVANDTAVLLEAELNALQPGDASASVFVGGVAFIKKYFLPWWLSPHRYEQWGKQGLESAQKAMDEARPHLAGLPGGKAPTTNNATESFNSWLKIIALTSHKQGGRRLRVDVMVSALSLFIFPFWFKKNKAKRAREA